MPITYRRLADFINASAAWLQMENPGPEKFVYALKKVQKAGKSAFRAYEEALEDSAIQQCAADDKGVILRDDKGGLIYTKEGLMLHKAEVRRLNEQEADLPPFFVSASNIPALPDDFKDAFEGFVIKSADEDGFSIVPHVKESDPEMVYDILTDTKIKASDRHFNPQMVDA